MKKLVMLIIVLALIVVQGYAQTRTAADHIDWDKMSEEISRSVEQSLEGLDIDLSDMELQLQDISKFKMDSNALEELNNIKVYASTLGVQEAREELRAQREAERERRNAERASNKTYAYTYSYNTNESHQTNGGDAFESISNIKGVEVVYITKALLGMMPDMDMPGVNVGKVAGKLESLQIYSAEDRAPATILKQTINKVVRSGNYETLMLVKDSDSKTAFYLKSEGKGKKSELLMVTEDGSDVSVIRMLGNFTLQDIQSLTKGQTIKK